MDFRERFSSLNDNQKAAVEQIYGPLLIIAGPGTGKTELLKCEMIYGKEELRRKVVEAMGDYQVATEDIQGDNDVVAVFGKP